MATEKIIRGDTYYKTIEVTAEDEDREKIPFDLTEFGQNFVAIKESRGIPDEDSFIFKPIPYSGPPEDGKMLVHLSPEETKLLPDMEEVESLFMFVQIGSEITGRVHEVSTFKIKTIGHGIGHITRIDKDTNMGPIGETVGWVFDMGSICDPVTSKIDLGGSYVDVFFESGSILDQVIKIEDFGKIGDLLIEVYDMGRLYDCND